MMEASTGFAKVRGVFSGGTSARGSAAHLKPHGESPCQQFSVCHVTAQRSFATRRLYRACYQRVIQEELQLATINSQGLDWCRFDNKQKLAGLVLSARQGKWNVCFVSDLHNSMTAVHTVCVEEYTLVVAGRVGILLDPPSARAWRLAGSKRYIVDSDRWMAITHRLHGRVYAMAAGYAPTQAYGAERAVFFEAGDELCRHLPTGACRIFGGDWNSHFGQEAEDHDWLGRHRLPTVTSGASWGL
jgi:hypothetical protein